jgi:hypothetical protein
LQKGNGLVTLLAVTTGSNVTRNALALALVVLAGLMAWVVTTRAATGQPVVLLLAVLPVVATVLLFVRRGIGATLAVVAALAGALFGLLLSICILCPAQPPLSPEAIALFATALVVFVLAVVELRTLSLAWVAVAIVVVVLAFSGTVGIIVAGLIVAAAVVWLLLSRRRSASRQVVSSGDIGQREK